MDNKSYNVRVPKRWARIAMIVGVAALIVAPLTALATHSFDDVPNSHTFHEDIEWMKTSDVTRGCNPPANDRYCPDDDVTRGQMAAFMLRLAQYMGAEDGTPAQADNAATADDAATLEGSSAADLLTGAATRLTSDEAGTPLAAFPTYTEVSTVQIEAPSSGAIVIQHSLSVHRSATDIAFRAGVSTGGNCSNVDGNTHAYGSVSTTSLWDTAAATATFSVGAGTHAFTLCGQSDSSAANIDGSSLTAIFVADGTTLPIVSSQGEDDSGGFGG